MAEDYSWVKKGAKVKFRTFRRKKGLFGGRVWIKGVVHANPDSNGYFEIESQVLENSKWVKVWTSAKLCPDLRRG